MGKEALGNKGWQRKKVLSLVLCVAVMLSVMVVGAGAAFSDQSKIKNTEAVDACVALNIIGGYGDNTYRPENNITRAEVCKMICVALNGGKEPTLSVPATPTFKDVRNDANSSWAEKYIESCVAQGIVGGVGNGMFEPNGSVTRAMLVTILYRQAGSPKVTGDNPFEDVAPGKYYTDAVIWAFQNGIVNGTTPTTFEPEEPVTREQIATILYRREGAPEVEQDLSAFVDTDQVSSYARAAMQWAVSEGVIKGSTVATAEQLYTAALNELDQNFSSYSYHFADLNGDGKISYAMFKGDEANVEAIYRTQFGVEDANAILTAAGKPELVYYNASATDKYLDASNSAKYQVDLGGAWSAQAALDYMNTNLSQYNEANGNMIELIICNNDNMAEGAISALEAAGYNTGAEGVTTIPVFGVDATEAAKNAIKEGSMVGTIKQDAAGMAEAISTIAQNMLNSKSFFEGITAENVVGTWRVNIPYATYLGE